MQCSSQRRQQRKGINPTGQGVVAEGEPHRHEEDGKQKIRGPRQPKFFVFRLLLLTQGRIIIIITFSYKTLYYTSKYYVITGILPSAPFSVFASRGEAVWAVEGGRGRRRHLHTHITYIHSIYIARGVWQVVRHRIRRRYALEARRRFALAPWEARKE